MNTSTRSPQRVRAAAGPLGHVHDNADLRPLLTFVGVALPVGWVLLSIPLVHDVPLSPFILGTLYLGLVLPAVLLTRRDPGASVRDLFRETIRTPRPTWLLLPAAMLIPPTVWGAGAVLGVDAEVDVPFLVTLALANVASSLLIVNLWEEMAWAGFVQRRASARWGYAGGAVVTALLFIGIHLPLSLYGAANVGDVASNLAAMVIAGVGLRLLIGAFDIWGHRSILALGLLHATFNASSELLEPDADWVRYAATFTLGLLAWGIHHATSTAAAPADAGRMGAR